MPVRDHLIYTPLPEEPELQMVLEAELREPTDNPEPIILIRRVRPRCTHLFVIWSKFDDLHQSVRSRIILNAFGSVRGELEASLVMVSMGLTQAEADRLGIS